MVKVYSTYVNYTGNQSVDKFDAILFFPRTLTLSDKPSRRDPRQYYGKVSRKKKFQLFKYEKVKGFFVIHFIFVDSFPPSTGAWSLPTQNTSRTTRLASAASATSSTGA